ncbi:MAG: hypothetical protein ACREAS_03020 [Nitrososphaera sp.]
MRQRFGAKLVVISDLLKMFVQDAQIDPDEAHWLLIEMVRSLRRLSSQVLVVVSLHECPPPQFRSLLLSICDNQIHIAATTKEPSRLQVKVCGSNSNLYEQHGGGRMSSSSFIVIERDLKIIPVR